MPLFLATHANLFGRQTFSRISFAVVFAFAPDVPILLPLILPLLFLSSSMERVVESAQTLSAVTSDTTSPNIRFRVRLSDNADLDCLQRAQHLDEGVCSSRILLYYPEGRRCRPIRALVFREATTLSKSWAMWNE